MKTIERTAWSPDTLAAAGPASLFKEALPQREFREARYRARFARTREELDAALKLRFEVFNLELGEGLQASFLTRRGPAAAWTNSMNSATT